ERMRDFLTEHWPERPSWLHTSGFVDDSAWLFSASDIFVSSSRAEGQSSAVGEALACGLPVVMSDIPGTSVWKPAPGLLTFHSEATTGLAKELERLLDEPTQVRYEMGLRSREWLEDNFSLDLWCDRICAIYREL